MGVVHFMPLGRNPGAVTAALAYLKHERGIQTVGLGRTIEAIVLFTPKEIKEGNRRQHRVESCKFNRYRELGTSKTYEDANVVEIVLDFIRQEIQPMMTKPTIYWCEAFANDYEKSLRSAAEAIAFHLSKPESKGKNLWVSLTGGTNIMNAALMQVAFLSGLISKLYYMFAPDGETNYLQPASDNFKFVEMPLMKTTVDESHLALLNVLKVMAGEWVSSEALISFLKPFRSEDFPDLPAYFSNVTQERLELEFLTQLDGRGLERETLSSGEKTWRVRLSADGEELLLQMKDPIFRALTKRGHTERGELDHLQHSFGWEKLQL